MREHVPGGSLQGLTACAGVSGRREEPWRAAVISSKPGHGRAIGCALQAVWCMIRDFRLGLFERVNHTRPQ